MTSVPPVFPDSKTHRLCFFKGAPEAHKHVAVPHYVADEVEGMRRLLRFLEMPSYRLCRPDLHNLHWSVWHEPSKLTYARGRTAGEALENAVTRFACDTDVLGNPYFLKSETSEESKPE